MFKDEDGQRSPRGHIWSAALLALAVGLFATTLAGCGDDAAGSSCTADSDCSGSNVCRGGACVDPNANNPNNPNNPEGCALDVDCEGGQICLASTCSDCTSDAQCAGETICTAGRCAPAVTNNPQGCRGDVECPAGQVCDDTTCGVRTCTDDVSCGSPGLRTCADGVCRIRVTCTSDADCGGDVCEAGQCVPPCVIDADCPHPEGQTCVADHCVPRCEADSDCAGVCDDGACVEAECTGTGIEGCPDGQRCATRRCVPYDPCTTDGDCTEIEMCLDGICEPRPTCIGDANCDPSEQCLDGVCMTSTACTTRDDCDAASDCVGGYCVPFVCRGAEDCEVDEICEEGSCQAPSPADGIARVVILTAPQTIFPAQEIPFQAVALNGDGDIVAGQTFQWSASNATVADIGANTGVAVGGDVAGTSSISVQAVGSGAAASDPVVLTNPGVTTANMARVTVVDARTGAPIVGALVDRSGTEVTTNSEGVAEFDIDAGPHTITIYEAAHNYLTFVGVSSNDILAPLHALSGNAMEGGFTGELDFSGVHTTGDINIGLAGASMDSELTNLKLQTLLGDSFNTSINIPGLFNQDFPLPGGIVIYGQVFGIPLDIKTTYYARTPGGLKVGWSFGGLVNGNEVMALAQGGGGSDIVKTILAFFEAFDHGVQPIEVEEFPLVADIDDIDGDTDTNEMIPDYGSFPTYGLSPFVRQTLRTSVQLPALPPFATDAGYAIVVGGVMNQGIGYVPLGINVSGDEDGDGIQDATMLKLAPVHSGLSEGDYAVVAITFDPNDFGAGAGGIDLPENISVRMWQDANMPTDLNMADPFLDLPSGTWDVAGRTFTSNALAGADLVRVDMINAAGSWEVWMPSGSVEFAVPTPPSGFNDWSTGARVEVEAFATDNDMGLDPLVTAGGASIQYVSTVSNGFSRAVVSE